MTGVWGPRPRRGPGAAPLVRSLIFALPLALFLVVGVYLWLGLGHDPTLLPSAMIDRPVPDFRLPALGAGPGLASADLRGRVQLVNVFASWCVPCRAEAPVLTRLARAEGVTIRGIAYKDRPEDAAAFLARYGNPYVAIGQDADGQVAIDWGVYGVPETYVIDAGGRIRYRQVGPIEAAAVPGLLALIRRLEAGTGS